MQKSRTFSEKLRAERADLNDLLERVVAAHGGLDRWKKFNGVTATVVGGGVPDSLMKFAGVITVFSLAAAGRVLNVL
jgi:hypothetical protein